MDKQQEVVMSAGTLYPVQVTGHLDPPLTRWLWLVKWLLVLPHAIVLAFLWIAFAVCSLVALVSILFTGRYPRGLFEFTVGVLRWTWRVAFYAFGALGTDRYPPFTLADVPDYPARLEIPYPEHLSRGLALVKWWLLALPHYIVLGIFFGTGGRLVVTDEGWVWQDTLGLLTVLVFVAAVVLLFTGAYPRPVFDFVLGLDRWALRVAAYAALMTDRYPPFRLDQGGDEPVLTVPYGGPPPQGAQSQQAPQGAQSQQAPQGAQPPRVSPQTAQPPMAQPPGTAQPSGPPPPGTAPPGMAPPGTAPPPQRPTIGAGRIILAVLASLVALSGLGMLFGGGALLVIDRTQRDADGFLMYPVERVDTGTYAMTAEGFRLRIDGPDWLVPTGVVDEVKVTATSEDGRPLFLGIAPESALDAYLAGVAHEAWDTRWSDRVTVAGEAPEPPGDQTFWVASGTGIDPELTWDVEEGDWAAALMRPDASPGIVADVQAGARATWLLPVAIGLAVGGAVLLVAGAVGTALALRSR